jgi:hypothetical protein
MLLQQLEQQPVIVALRRRRAEQRGAFFESTNATERVAGRDLGTSAQCQQLRGGVSRPGLRQRSQQASGANRIATFERDAGIDLDEQGAFLVALDAIADLVEQSLRVPDRAAEYVLACGE